MGPIHSLGDILDMVRRRALLILAIIALGSAVSVLFALSRQHVYRSTEVIQIEQPRVADELAPSTVGGSSARRLQLIQQRLMTRGTMLELIDRYGLFRDAPGLTETEKVALMRESIFIEGQAAAREGYSDDGTISVLSITAEMPTPRQAQAVASDLAARTVELSAASRIEEARETLAFFTRQEEVLARRIAQLEDEIARFRLANDLSIEGSLQFRRDEIAAIRQALLDIERERITVERELNQITSTVQINNSRLTAPLQTRLDALEEQRLLLERRAAQLETQIGTSPEVQRALNEFQRDLTQLQTQFDVIQTRRAEAEVGFRIESQRNSERLTVIEAAALPELPITPPRKRFAIMGAAASAVLALLIAWLLELRNPVIRSAAQMQRELGIMPVVSVPHLNVSDRPPGVFRRTGARIAWLFGLRDAEPPARRGARS